MSDVGLRVNGAVEESTATYYDQPALKPSFYGWKVSAYMFVGGLAGSAQIIAAAAAAAGGGRYVEIVRNGRRLALAGALAGTPLLIVDLQTPRRFYNMLRIFRPTSPMSIGSYVLIGFGALSALLAGLDWVPDRGPGGGFAAISAAVLQVPAALLGATMCSYTGALLGATSTPLWAAAPRLLPAAFGAAAMSSGSAALLLAGGGAAEPALKRLEAVSTAVEICLLSILERRVRERGVATGIGLLPVVLLSGASLLGAAARPRGAENARRSRLHFRLGPIAVLAAGLLLRQLILQAGNRSAQHPRDHFRFASRR